MNALDQSHEYHRSHRDDFQQVWDEHEEGFTLTKIDATLQFHTRPSGRRESEIAVSSQFPINIAALTSTHLSDNRKVIVAIENIGSGLKVIRDHIESIAIGCGHDKHLW